MSLLYVVSESGVAVHNSEAPDTITTWNAEAFAINRETGLGISPLKELVVKKDVFVSLELPFSIIFQETLTVTPIIFNFGRQDSLLVRTDINSSYVYLYNTIVQEIIYAA